MVIPDQITVGDTLKFIENLPGYSPDDGFELQYVLVNAGNIITISSTDNGDGCHLVNQDITNTAQWSPGHYSWVRYALKGATERYSIGNGKVEVLPDFASASAGLDARSEWQSILDNLMEAYQKLTKTSATTVTVSIAGRSVTYRDAADLLTQITNARKHVRREQTEQKLRDGLPSGNKIQFRL